ncbi:hypothetical protein HF841_09385 [Bacteroides eggerthii]|mgnify:CR=1|jgi:hypothetical protein|uniref:Uncharacterized protein n=1 Tax=Bacteroides eggerthii TaxID=28111 RepID=A0A7X9SBW3_9BACE|nr:hypothetical protein [Bacteroides eggerthii]
MYYIIRCNGKAAEEKCTVCKSRSRSSLYARHEGRAEREVHRMQGMTEKRKQKFAAMKKKLNTFAAFILKTIYYDGK